MRLGEKVTVVYTMGVFPTKPPSRFLRCRVIRRLPAAWQLYDPLRDYSYGIPDRLAGQRVIEIQQEAPRDRE